MVVRTMVFDGLVQRSWGKLVLPSAVLADPVDRERSRMLSGLLVVLLGCGLLSGLLQLLFIDDFVRTFRPMAWALCGVALAYLLSRTKTYRSAAALAAGLVIAACVSVRVANPHDQVWCAFMLIGVLISATFLPLSWAIATAVAAFGATCLGFALSSGFSATEEWLPALMLHAVLSPLLIVLSHHRASIEAHRVEELRAREVRLLELQHLETLGRFAAGVAHDFNNLLCVVSMNTEWLLHNREFSEAAIGEVRDAAGGAKRLVDQLQAFTRKERSTPRAISPNHVIEELTPILRRMAGSGVDVDVKLDPAVPLVNLDPVQLERVVINLVVNACEAMPEGGRLEISTAAQPHPAERNAIEAAVLRVSDTGRGMDAATREAIFEPFFTTKREKGGSGLGLAIVHAIAMHAGGRIDVQSELGRGSTFEVVFPGKGRHVADLRTVPGNDEGPK